MRSSRPAAAAIRGAPIALALVGASMLAACGYHLRGSEGLPSDFSQVSVQVQSSGLYDGITELLQSSGVTLVTPPQAELRIVVDHEDMSERLLSVDPTTGKAREYELAYSASFSVRDKTGQVVVPSQQVRIVRDYVFDPDAVIGKSRERGVLEAEMRRDAAQRIFARIRAAYRNKG